MDRAQRSREEAPVIITYRIQRPVSVPPIAPRLPIDRSRPEHGWGPRLG